MLPTNAKVDLTGATIAIQNIYTSATIKIEDGNMDFSGKSRTVAALNGSVSDASVSPAITTISNYFMVPQTFETNAKVVVTLTNGATYSIPLKDCVVSGGSTPITAWERGKNYTYTIHIEKERVQTHVLVKDWDAVAGSGTATLEW